MSQPQDAGETSTEAAQTTTMADRVRRLDAAIEPPSRHERAFSTFGGLGTPKHVTEPDNRAGGARPRP